ncbi:DEAD/DEAH box helicase [Wenzhouxiangella sp. EGI_FJ10409]|uniref:DEAD/DEAH box helicase n=1 Tax=Wenzhouxiangella sp. EGI_FJ10409 TaxID=3243767 RepID=UPI0035D8C2A0
MDTRPHLDPGLIDSLPPESRRLGGSLQAAGVVHLQHLGQHDGRVIVTGIVGDSERDHRVYISLEGGRLEADCSCRPGGDCEHVAALMAAAVANPRPARSAPATGGKPGARSPESGMQYMAWLLRLSEAGDELSVCPSRVAETAHGPVAIPFSLARIHDDRQPGYVGESDLAILHALADHAIDAEGLVWHPLAAHSGRLLADIIATEHCHWQDAEGPTLSLGKPLEATAQWRRLESGWQQLVLEPAATGGLIRLPLAPPWWLDSDSGRCHRLESALETEQLTRLLAAGPVAPEAVDETVSWLASAPETFPRPAAQTVTEVAAGPSRARLALGMIEIGRDGYFEREPSARLLFDYGAYSFDWDEAFDTRADGPGRVVRIERDSAAEQACLDELLGAGLIAVHELRDRDYGAGEGGRWVARDRRREAAVWIDFQRRFEALRRTGWCIEIAEDFVPQRIEPEDWYGEMVSPEEGAVALDFGIVWRGQRQSLIAALASWLELAPEALLRDLLLGDPGEGEVSLWLDEQHVVAMPFPRLAATLRALIDSPADRQAIASNRVVVPRSRLVEVAQAARHWSMGGEPELAALSQRLARFEGIEPADPPDGFQARLREYQRYGLGWLQFLREFGFGGILADDMGLGKTLQTLAHVLTEKRAGRLQHPCLVVAPTSLLFNWRAESRRFAPELKVLMLHGPNRRGLFGWIKENDLVLTSYPLVLRDIGWLVEHEFELLVLDEAQAIKNPRARVSRLVRRLRARHHLCLTGTPLENHLGELWSLFDFLMPGLLGSQTHFRRHVRNPVERHGEDAPRQWLERRIRPFFLRRSKREVAPELPAKTEITRRVALTEAQHRLYERTRVVLHDKVHRALAEKGVEKSRIVVLDALLRLRQICCDPRLIAAGERMSAVDSAKLQLLMELLPELVAEGRRVLLFSQFVGMLELIERAVREAGIDYVKLTGRTRNRQRVVERFQTGRVPLFLVSLKAGGVGLNLTAADTVIHYDPWWNPAVEDQATDRAHRIGQARKVFVYRLLAEGTIEQKVFELQQTKRGLIEGLLGSGGAASLEVEDLQALLAPLEEPA